MLDTFGEILAAMDKVGSLDLRTGKFSSLWQPGEIQQRLGLSAVAFSAFKLGRRTPTLEAVSGLEALAREMGSKGQQFLEPLQRLYRNIERLRE